jgi:DNA-binding NarL/FixJ family response regulator
MARARLLIVDDDEDMLAVLQRWCTKEGFEVETACDGFDALGKLDGGAFDLVLTDLVMPRMDGLKLLEMLNTYDSTIQVVVLTGQGSLETAVQALREGKAFDYKFKPLGDLSELTRALGRALDRRKEVTTLIARSKEAEAAEAPLDFEAPFGQLTVREREIAALLARGFHPDQIAEKLKITAGTLKNYLSEIYEKLGVRGRAEVVARFGKRS